MYMSRRLFIATLLLIILLGGAYTYKKYGCALKYDKEFLSTHAGPGYGRYGLRDIYCP